MTAVHAPDPPSDTEITALIHREIGVVPTAITRLRSGAWSSAIAITAGERNYVLRFSKSPDDFHCDAFAAQYANVDLPIPRVVGIGKLHEHWWCISDQMPGIHLDEIDAAAMEQTLPSIARLLIAIRAVPSDSNHGYGGWDEHGNGVFGSFAQQLLGVGIDDPNARGGGWSPVLAKAGYARRVFETGLVELERLCVFLPADRHLIHEDTPNYNVTVENNEISGIFDWGTAMWGDAVYDLAWFRFWAPWYPQWQRLDVADYLEQKVGIIGPNSQERMRCCLLHIGLMHIRYNAFTGNLSAMNDVAKETEKLLRSDSSC